MPKVKPGIKLFFVNGETLQQDAANNLPFSLCLALEGEPSDDEEMPGIQCAHMEEGILTQQLRLSYKVML